MKRSLPRTRLFRVESANLAMSITGLPTAFEPAIGRQFSGTTERFRMLCGSWNSPASWSRWGCVTISALWGGLHRIRGDDAVQRKRKQMKGRCASSTRFLQVRRTLAGEPEQWVVPGGGKRVHLWKTILGQGSTLLVAERYDTVCGRLTAIYSEDPTSGSDGDRLQLRAAK